MSAVRLLPWPVHEGIEYALGLFLVLAAFIFDLRDSTAFPVFVAAGVVLLALAMLSEGPLGVVDVVPVSVHAGIDYLLGFFLIVAAFVFGYSEVDGAVAISVFLGAALLVVTLVTRFPVRAEDAASSEPSGAA